MKKSKFFALAALTTLAAVSVFGTKPAKKFAGVSEIYSNTTLFSASVASSVLTTRSGTGFGTCQFKVGTGGTAVTLITASGSTTKVHFHN
jgi:hypothetical protein